MGEITGGQPVAQQTESLALPQFQLPAGVTARTIADMQADAQTQLETIPKLAIGSGVNPDLWNTPIADRSKADNAYIKSIKELTGFELTSPQTLGYDRPKGLFHMADGTAVLLDGYQIAPVVDAGFGAAYNDASNRGRAFRFMTKSLKSLVNFETFIGWLDDASGTIRTLLQDLKRETQRRASYANVLLQPLQIATEQALVPFSKQASGLTTKLIEVTTYDYDEAGAVIQREVSLPIAVAMEMVSIGKSQMASYGVSSVIRPVAPSQDELYRKNADGSFTRRAKGAAYFDQDSQQTSFLLLSQQDFDALQDRFETGNGAYDGEQSAFRSIGDFYNQPEIVKLLTEENQYLNPDKPFDAVSFYYPLQGYSAEADARQESRGFSRTLDESRQLVTRQSASDAVLLRDPLQTMGVYKNAINDVLSYGRLTENLMSFSNGLKSDYNGPEREYILNYLKNRIDDFQSHRAKRTKAYHDKAHLRGLETLMRRYTSSVFSLNGGLPAKQLGTYTSAYGQGIIGDEHLRSSEALGLLAKLSGGAYADWAAPSTVNFATGDGLKGITGNDTTERQYLDELFGNTDLFPDQLSKDRQIKRFATVLDRLTTSQTIYTGDVELGDIVKTNALDKAQKGLAKMDEWTQEYGLAAMKRADRAVILSFVSAAKQQASAEGLSQDSDEFWDRVADLSEKTVYMTNQMSYISEQSQMQASTDFFSKILGLYSGQQQKLVNQVMSALTNWIKADSGSQEAEVAWKRLAHAFGWSVLFNSIWVATVSTGVSALMAILSGREPRDDWQESIGWNFIHNIIGSVPGLGSEAVDFWASQHDNIRGNESMLDVTALQTLERGMEALDGAAMYMISEDPEKREKSLDSTIFATTEFLAKASGTPSSIVKITRGLLLEGDKK